MCRVCRVKPSAPQAFRGRTSLLSSPYLWARLLSQILLQDIDGLLCSTSQQWGSALRLIRVQVVHRKAVKHESGIDVMCADTPMSAGH